MAKKSRKATAPASNMAETSTSASLPSPKSSQPSQRTWSLILDVKVRRAFYLVLLAALYAPLSQLILGPVYGSIPSFIYHKYGLIASSMLSFLVKDYLPTRVERSFACFAFWIPILHFILIPLSSVFGNPWGPVITECLTLWPVVTISISLATNEIATLDLRFLGENLAEAAPAMFNYLMFIVFERFLRVLLPTWMGMNILFTRLGLQSLTAATYMAVIPRSYVWPALPAVAFNVIGNVHVPLDRTTEVLNNTLHLSGYSLVDRHESITGYISVLQDNTKNFRVMRCDHSLLGGEWLLPSSDDRKVAEPVYAVFTMLEAVRLVERKKPETQEQALNIGLGVGTAPSALMAHGVRTTIIELDSTVYRFARQYFNLPQNHSAYFGDAALIVAAKQEEQQEFYDYIIHDVFTGGAEPAQLFTYEFLAGLRQMLKPDGVIAINYAGDLSMPSTSIIYRTILDLFPSCRVFREDDQIAEHDTTAGSATDFTNMVFICTKKHEPFRFRKAIEADYLGSASRKAYMVPKHEVPASKFEQEGELLYRRNIKMIEKMHVQSAIGHWKLMRTVIPAAIWENW